MVNHMVVSLHKWVSSAGTDLNHDYHVSFTSEGMAAGEIDYSYARQTPSVIELSGISAFHRDTSGAVFHTYSCHPRGIDAMNAAYGYLEGRNETGLPYPRPRVRDHDKYAN
jgi:predicted dithiol-disulfide oxidoreductase (DUF899 family)